MAEGDPYISASNTVEHGTPTNIVGALAEKWAPGGFDLDVAASDELHVVDRYYTAADDGLALPWLGACWCNPPYGCVEEAWVRKGVQEVLVGNASVVVYLLPAKTGKAWWRKYVAGDAQGVPGSYLLRYPVVAVDFLPGRIHFIGNKHTAPFACVVVVMADYRKLGPKGLASAVPGQLDLF